MPIGSTNVYNPGDLILSTVSGSGTSFIETKIIAATSSFILFNSSGTLTSASLNSIVATTSSYVSGSTSIITNLTASNISASGTSSFGMVGIGTTSPSAKLQIGTQTYGTAPDATYFVAGNNDFSGPGPVGAISGYPTAANRNQVTASIFDVVSGWEAVNGSHAILRASAYNVINSTPAFVVLCNGNVGIGTTSPGALLDVNGLFRFQQDIRVNNGTDKLILSATSTTTELHSAGTTGIVFKNSGNNEIVRFDAATGNVGIGTTVPVAKLQVAGNISGSSFTSSISNAVGFLGTSSWAINASTASYVSPSGNTFVQGGNSFGTTAVLGTNDAQSLALETNGTTRMSINNNGNVAINTSTSGIYRLNIADTHQGSLGSSSLYIDTAQNQNQGLATSANDSGITNVYTVNNFTSSAAIQNQAIFNQIIIAGSGSFSGSYRASRNAILFGNTASLDINGNIINTWLTNQISSNIPNFNITNWIAGTSTYVDLITGNSTGSITNLYQHQINSPFPSGGAGGITVTNSYGVYIGKQKTTNIVTNGWGIYQVDTGDLNIFAGKTRIGSTTVPVNALDVTGNISASVVTASLFFGTASWASNALTASFLPVGTYNITSSWASNALTASYLVPTNSYTITNLTASNISASATGSFGIVGIGTTSPTSKLNVVETTATGSRIQLGTSSENALMNSGSTNDLLILNAPYGVNPATTSNIGAKWGIKFIGSTDALSNSLGKTSAIYAVSEDTLGYNRGTSLAFYTNQFNDIPYAERMRIYHNGNIGIGTTSPGYKLTIQNDAASTNALLALQNLTASATTNHGVSILPILSDNTGSVAITAGGLYWLKEQQWTNDTTSRDSYLRIDTTENNSASEKVRITSAGNVGIGTTVPADKLEIEGGIRLRTGGVITLRNATNDSSAAIYNAGGAASSVMYLAVGPSPTMTIGGNVGIGTTTPTAKLHVSGSTGGVFEVDTAGGVTSFYVSASGNVGIGTTAPGELLDIAASADNSAVAGPKVNFKKGATTKAVIGIGGNYLGQATNTDDLIFRNDAGNILFGFSGAEKMRINSGGNVGIGTTTPGALLEISSSTAASLLNVKGAGGNGILFVSGSGNVGIGTTVPVAKLQVAGNISGSSFTSSISNAVGFLGTSSWASNALTASFLPVGTYNITSSWSTNALTASYLVPTNSYTITNLTASNISASATGSFGIVGIGTTIPSEKLHVVGNGLITSGSAVDLRIDVSGTGNASLTIDRQTTGAESKILLLDGNVSQWGIAAKASSNNFVIRDADSTERFTILKSGGNVGIGTSSPASKLHISGSGQTIMRLDSDTTSSVSQFQIKAASDAVLIMGMLGGSAASTNFGVTAAGQAYFGTSTLGSPHPTSLVIGNVSNIPIAFSTNNVERMRIDGVGNVGIGTTSATNKLEVIGGTNTRINLGNIDDVNRGGKLEIISGSATARQFYVGTNSAIYNLVFGIDSIEKMRIDTAGNVGIGTTSPAYLLDVSGSSRHGYRAADTHQFTGSVSVSGSLNATASWASNALTASFLPVGTYNITSSWSTNALTASYLVPTNSYTITNLTASNISASGTGSFNRVGIGTTNLQDSLTIGSLVSSSLLIQNNTYNNLSNGIQITSNLGFLNGASGNLNFARWTGGTVTDFVGIGQSSGPTSYDLQFISGRQNTGSAINYFTSSAVRMTIQTTTGNVGIGTTSPGEKLTVSGSSYIIGGTGAVGTGTAYYLGDSSNKDISLTRVGTAALAIGRYFPSAWAETIRFTADGYVVINNSTQFTTGGNAQLSISTNTTAVALSFGASNTDMSYIRRLSSAVYQWQTINGGNDGEIHLQPYGGNVGIGTTSPSARLHVVSGSSIITNPNPAANSAVLLVQDEGTATTVTSGTTLRVVNNGSAASFSVFEASSAVSNFVILNNGNVGIGVTNPLGKLHITGSTTANENLLYLSKGSGSIAQLYITAVNQSGQLNYRLTSDINGHSQQTLYHNGTAYVYNDSFWSSWINNNNYTQGGLGIGTTSLTHGYGVTIARPATSGSLYVSGSSVFTGSVNISGSVTFSGPIIYDNAVLLDYGNVSTPVVSTNYVVLQNLTGSYNSAFFDYFASSGSNFRAGTVIAGWSGNNVNYTEYSTTDVGNTNQLSMSVDLSGSFVRLLTTVSTTINWNIKTAGRYL